MKINIFNFLGAIALSFLHATCQAEDINGIWTLSKSIDYENPHAPPSPPPANSLHIVNQNLVLPSGCFIRLNSETFYPDRPFQALLKSGESQENIYKFAARQFGFQFNVIRKFYHADPIGACNLLGSDFFIQQDKLIVIHAGFSFHAFIKDKNSITADARKQNKAALPENLKITPLPFSISNYMAQCAGNLPIKKGVLQRTSNCSPIYHPHVASRESKDYVSKIVGSLNYYEAGVRGSTRNHENPVSNGLHPVFLILPPFGDVLLIRVDDLEWSQNRDAMSGTYVSIKNGRIAALLNEGCNFDTSYVCSSTDSDKRFQLQPDGTFKIIR